MRKLLVLILLACTAFICTESHAQKITASKAMEVAEMFISQVVPSTRGIPALEKVWDSNMLTNGNRTRYAADDAPTFHAFSIGGQGFVIVAGEEVGNDIIGYSFDSPVPEEVPAGMIDYLNSIDSQIRSIRAKGTATRGAVTETTKLGNEVVNLNTATWGQNAPFNKFCFTKNGAQAKTGCVPTAFAIVMRHHKWPVSRPVRLYNPITGEPIEPGHVYDWDNMPLDYSGTYTDEQAEQVATLMRDLGYAYMVTYNTGSTEGNPNAYTMTNKFNYVEINSGSPSGMTNRATVGEEEWERLIRESLDNNCPIPYQATNSGSGSDARHIFVLDGYTDNGYYRFNWGWNGAYNGYYTLANMDPTSTDQYAGGGINSHFAIFNLKPAKSDVTITATVNTPGTGSAKANGMECVTVEEGCDVTLTATPADGYIFTKWTLNEEIISKNAETTVKALEDAEYTAHFTTIGETPDITISVAATEGGTASIAGNGSVTVKAGTEVTITAVAGNGYIFENWSVEETVVSTNATYTTIAYENRTYTANFSKTEENETVRIMLNGNGGTRTITCNGTTVSNKYMDVPKGSIVTLNTENAENTFAFFTLDKTYNDGGTIISNKSTYTFTATSNAKFYINYIGYGTPQSFDLNTVVKTEVSGNGYASIDGMTSKEVKYGDEITLTATADNGYKFTSWTVNSETIGIEPIITTIVQKEATYTANFEVNIQAVTVSVEAGYGGYATVNGKSTVTVEAGSTVMLAATPYEGYRFVNWTSDGIEVSTEEIFTAVAEKDAVYTANFEENNETAITISEQEKAKEIVFDLYGRNVKQLRQKGIYIIDGRKKAVK